MVHIIERHQKVRVVLAVFLLDGVALSAAAAAVSAAAAPLGSASELGGVVVAPSAGVAFQRRDLCNDKGFCPK